MGFLLITAISVFGQARTFDSHLHVVDSHLGDLAGAEIFLGRGGASLGFTSAGGRFDFQAELDAANSLIRFVANGKAFANPGQDAILELPLWIEKSDYNGRTTRIKWRNDPQALERGYVATLWTDKDLESASVIVRNPTHYAVALRYDRMTMPMPLVMAKAADAEVNRLVQLTPCVPKVDSPQLARQLYEQVDVGETVPPDFRQAIEDVLSRAATPELGRAPPVVQTLRPPVPDASYYQPPATTHEAGPQPGYPTESFVRREVIPTQSQPLPPAQVYYAPPVYHQAYYQSAWTYPTPSYPQTAIGWICVPVTSQSLAPASIYPQPRPQEGINLFKPLVDLLLAPAPTAARPAPSNWYPPTARER